MRAAPTATRTPRTRILLKLLSDRVGLWIPAQEMAEIIGPQHEVYIRELQAQGRSISERREYHGAQSLRWFRLNRRATW
jgi:hypothetical protein